MTVPYKDLLIQQQAEGGGGDGGGSSGWRFTYYPNKEGDYVYGGGDWRFRGGNRAVHVVDREWRVRSSFSLRGCLPGFETHSAESTAGSKWSEHVIGFLHREGNDATWKAVIISWWGGRVVIDLEPGRERVISGDADQSSSSDSVLREYKETVLRGLSRQAAGADPTVENEALLATQTSFSHHAGLLKLREAEEDLRKLEKHPLATQTPSGMSIPIKGGGWKSYRIYGVRRSVHIALRRIGCQPGGYPAVLVGKSFYRETDEPPDVPTDLSRRHQLVQELASSSNALSTIDDVQRLLGPPDFVSRSYWRYDVDGGSCKSELINSSAGEEATQPYTLMIWFQDASGHPIEKAAKLSPPLWELGQPLFPSVWSTNPWIRGSFTKPLDADTSLYGVKDVLNDFQGTANVLFDRTADKQTPGDA